MAGRGTDIKLTEESREIRWFSCYWVVKDMNLVVLITSYVDVLVVKEILDISRFYVSLEDSLMVRFGGDKLQKLFEKYG